MRNTSSNRQHSSTTELPLRPLLPRRSQVLTFFSRRLGVSAVQSKNSPRDLRPSAPPPQNTISNPQHPSTTEPPLRPLPPRRSQVLTFFSRRLRASAVTSKTSPRDLRPSAPPRQDTNLPRIAAIVLLSFSLVFA